MALTCLDLEQNNLGGADASGGGVGGDNVNAGGVGGESALFSDEESEGV